MENYILWNILSIYSIFHFLIPLGMGAILKRWWLLGIIILVVHEIIENLTDFTLSIFGWWIVSPPEPFVNIVSDVIIGTIGLYLGYKLRLKLKKAPA